MHTEDLFLNEEKKLLLADVFISRSILNGSVELNFMNTFRDLYESSMQFVHYEGKLYGPQEEELGEELSNPLFFAKEVRHRKKGLQELIDRMSEHSNEDLKKTCRELGLKDHGTKRELMDRLMEALSRKKDLIGHGELSQFAKDILSSIYHSVKQDLVYDLEGSAGSAGRQVLSRKGSPGKKEERGLTVWEFNKLLHKTQTK